MPDSGDVDGAAGDADSAGADGTTGDADAGDEPLPESVIEDAERLTRLARGAVDDEEASAYRTERDELLAEHGYTARVREEDASDDATLVCYPGEWVEDGVVQVKRIDDVDRGVERSLEGTGDGEWETVAAHNEEFVDTVAERYDEPHVSTLRALAEFASNHYAKPVEDLTPAERREFAEEYFPRNAWPSEEQLAALEESLEIAAEEIETVSGDPP